ncbi:hypothetical protein [Pseudoclavibacter sp. AY1F1]|nr:hypothetical protein [Pseudoclavibacter sp. AY1F1]
MLRHIRTPFGAVPYQDCEHPRASGRGTIISVGIITASGTLF